MRTTQIYKKVHQITRYNTRVICVLHGKQILLSISLIFDQNYIEELYLLLFIA